MNTNDITTATVYDNSKSIALFKRPDLSPGTEATGPMRHASTNDEPLRAWSYDDGSLVVASPDGVVYASGTLVASEKDNVDHEAHLTFERSGFGYGKGETIDFLGWDNTATSRKAKREGKIGDLEVINLRPVTGRYVDPRNRG
jgi:hypothetical protein